jgi:hypothetical protein
MTHDAPLAKLINRLVDYFCLPRMYFTPATAPMAATKAKGPATPALGIGTMQPAIAAEPERMKRPEIRNVEMRIWVSLLLFLLNEQTGYAD